MDNDKVVGQNIAIKCNSKTEHLYLYCMVTLIAISGVTLLYGLYSIGYTTRDDFGAAFWLKRGLFKIAIQKAEAQGRINFALHFLLYPIAHFFDSMYYFHTVTILPILLSLFLYTRLIGRFVCDSRFTLFLASFYVVNIQNSWNHNLLTSYPGVLTLPWCMLFLSLIWFLDSQNGEYKYRYILSILAYLFCICIYEPFILYFPLFIVIYLTSSKTFKYALLPYIIAILIFIVTVVSYRVIHPSNYDGTQLGRIFSLDFVRTTWQFSISAFPPYIYFVSGWLFNSYLDSYGIHNWSVLYLLKNSHSEWLLKCVFMGLGTYLFIVSLVKTPIKGKVVKWLAFIAFVYIFTPNVLQGMTVKYQRSVMNGATGYLSTYFSYYAVTLFLCSIMCLIFSSMKKRWLTAAIAVVFSLLMAWISLCVDYSNYYYFKSQRQSYLKVDTLNKMLGSNLLSNNSIVFAPSLFSDSVKHGIAKYNLQDMTSIARFRYNSNIIFSDKYNINDFQAHYLNTFNKFVEGKWLTGDIGALSCYNEYYLRYIEDHKSYDSFIILTSVDRNSPRTSNTKKITIFNNSKFDYINISFPLLKHEPTTILVNNVPCSAAGSFFSTRIHFDLPNVKTASIVIDNGFVDIDSILLSSFVP